MRWTKSVDFLIEFLLPLQVFSTYFKPCVKATHPGLSVNFDNVAFWQFEASSVANVHEGFYLELQRVLPHVRKWVEGYIEGTQAGKMALGPWDFSVLIDYHQFLIQNSHDKRMEYIQLKMISWYVIILAYDNAWSQAILDLYFSISFPFSWITHYLNDTHWADCLPGSVWHSKLLEASLHGS